MWIGSLPLIVTGAFGHISLSEPADRQLCGMAGIFVFGKGGLYDMVCFHGQVSAGLGNGVDGIHGTVGHHHLVGVDMAVVGNLGLQRTSLWFGIMGYDIEVSRQMGLDGADVGMGKDV